MCSVVFCLILFWFYSVLVYYILFCFVLFLALFGIRWFYLCLSGFIFFVWSYVIYFNFAWFLYYVYFLCCFVLSLFMIWSCLIGNFLHVYYEYSLYQWHREVTGLGLKSRPIFLKLVPTGSLWFIVGPTHHKLNKDARGRS